MTAQLVQLSETVRRLASDVERLEPCALDAGLAPLDRRSWYEVLLRKLIPQLSADSYLVVAVVGGTNIGKSAIFNHIVGRKASASSPLASGTRHPVCVAPPEFSRVEDMARVFPGFAVERWVSAEAALEDNTTHRLFFITSDDAPPNLLVLDTPDIDSDARVNWERADHIRQAADLLIAVLTQQKYNDAAVKHFFREAARDDKPVLVVFNQCLLPEDEEYWPRWLETFERETGIDPEWVYLAPNDRRAAEALQLPFFRRPVTGAAGSNEPHKLLEDLSRLHFGDLKVRALRGALEHVLDDADGAPAYCADIERAAQNYAAARGLLCGDELASVKSWPTLSSSLLIAELRAWWSEQRDGWPARVHGFYNTLGRGLTWPVRKVRERVRGDVPSAWDQYRNREWSAVLTVVEKVYDRLTTLAQAGNEILSPRLDQLLSGTSRSELIASLRRSHDEAALHELLAQLVRKEMSTFREESPTHYRLFRKLDAAAAAARPATSVVLFLSGLAPVGHALTPVLADGAMQGVLHVVGDVAGGTMAAAVGDAVISEGASTSVGYLESKLRGLQAAFAQERVAWLADQLHEHLLGSLTAEIAEIAELTSSDPYRTVQARIVELRSALAEVPIPSVA